MDHKSWIIVALCVVIAVLIVGAWSLRQITIRENTIAILNYHLGQLRQQQQPMIVKKAPQKPIVVQEVQEAPQKALDMSEHSED